MTDNTNPEHYRGFSNGAEVIDISENLTSNGAQAVQYIARSTRLDGNNKGDVIEDLRKAVWFVEREIERLTPAPEWVYLGFLVEDEPVDLDEPQVWAQLSAVPKGDPSLKLSDRHGRVWFPKNGSWHYTETVDIGDMQSFKYNNRGPFTEVKETA